MDYLKIAFEHGSAKIIDDADIQEMFSLIGREHEKQVNARAPVFVRLEHEVYGALAIGVGVPDRLFFTHDPADGEPPYSRSIGCIGHIGTVVYLYDGSPTEIDVKNTVHSDHLQDVVSSFAVDGSLSRKIEWELVQVTMKSGRLLRVQNCLDQRSQWSYQFFVDNRFSALSQLL